MWNCSSIQVAYLKILKMLSFTYRRIIIDAPPLIAFSSNNNILMWANSFYLTSTLFKAACHADIGAVRKWKG